MKTPKEPIVAILSMLVAMLCGPSAALSPPAPPQPTIGEIVQSAQAVFVGRVESTVWRPILPNFRDAGTIELTVKVTNVLLGDTRVIRNRITYGAGTASLTEAQAKARYNGKLFVFAGEINRPRGSEIEIVLPPSGKPPFELSMVDEFTREISEQKGVAGPRGHRPGNR